jgi:transcription elongation factor GreA
MAEQSKIYITKQRLAEIEEEVRQLKVHGRKEVAGRIAEARAQGDLSENAEYDAAREEQGLLELRIKKLEEILTRSSIIDERDIPTDKVGIMSKVKVLNEKTKRESEYQVVSEQEADFEGGRISVSSPIGKALLNHKVGEQVQVKVPAGVLSLKIVGIDR